MALADSVPGVSGGTIAFILGFYDKFIGSLDGLIYGDKEKKKESITFLIKLGIGWIVGMALAALVLANVFQTHIYSVSSLFLGFVLFSIPLIIKQEKDNLKGKYKNLIFTVIGIIIVVLIAMFNPISGQGNTVDITNLNFTLILYIFIVAAIAVSAMILPGISGSTLLLIFGLYVPIMTGVKEILQFNFSYIPALIVFGFGIIVGVVVMIKLVKIALKKYRSQTIYCIVGLMLGSLYAIIMGPTTLDIPQEAMGFSTFRIIFFIIGGAVVIGLEKLKQKLEVKETKKIS